MANQDILKEFLVRLGFKVDESSFKKFGPGVSGATKEVAMLGVGVTAAGVATETFAIRFAASLVRLYFATARAGASAAEIGDFSGRPETRRICRRTMSSLEALARFRRTTPGADSILGHHGVHPEDLNDAANSANELAVGLREPHNVLLAYRLNDSLFHFDEKTLLAMLNPDFHVGHDVADMYRQMGMSQDNVLKKSHDFEVQLQKKGTEAGTFGAFVESKLLGPIARFADKLLQSFNELRQVIEYVEGHSVKNTLNKVDDAVGSAVAARLKDRTRQTM